MMNMYRMVETGTATSTAATTTALTDFRKQMEVKNLHPCIKLNKIKLLMLVFEVIYVFLGSTFRRFQSYIPVTEIGKLFLIV